jgi:hypothetical protein
MSDGRHQRGSRGGREPREPHGSRNAPGNIRHPARMNRSLQHGDPYDSDGIMSDMVDAYDRSAIGRGIDGIYRDHREKYTDYKTDGWGTDQFALVIIETVLLVLTLIFCALNYSSMMNDNDQLNSDTPTNGDLPSAFSWYILYMVMAFIHGGLFIAMNITHICARAKSYDVETKTQHYIIGYSGAKLFSCVSNAFVAALCSRASSTFLVVQSNNSLYVGKSLFTLAQLIGLVLYIVAVPVTANAVSKITNDTEAMKHMEDAVDEVHQVTNEIVDKHLTGQTHEPDTNGMDSSD